MSLDNAILRAATQAPENNTPQENAFAADYATLPPEAFVAKYGPEAYASARTQERVLQNTMYDLNANAGMTEEQNAYQMAKSTAANIASATLSGIASLTPDKFMPENLRASYYLSRAAEGIQKLSQDLDVEAVKAGRNAESILSALDNETNDRLYEKDIKDGKGVFEATAAKVVREAVSSADRASRTGLWKENAYQGLGFLAPQLGAMKLMSLAGAGVAKLGAATLPKATKAATDFVAKHPGLTSKVKFGAAGSLLEGADSFQDTLLQVMDTPDETLYKNNETFREAVDAYVNEGMSKEQAFKAAESVKWQIAKEAANLHQSGTALLTSPLEMMSSHLVAPLRGILGKSLGRTLVEPIESAIGEGAQEGTNKLLGNLVAQRYYDPNRKTEEGVGESIYQGAAGTVGTTAIHGTPGALVQAGKLAGKGAFAGATLAAKGIGKGLGYVADKIGGDDTDTNADSNNFTFSGSTETASPEGTPSTSTTEETPSFGASTDEEAKQAPSTSFTASSFEDTARNIYEDIKNNSEYTDEQKTAYKDRLNEFFGNHVINDGILDQLDPETKTAFHDAGKDITDNEGNVVRRGSLAGQLHVLSKTISDPQADIAKKGKAAFTMLRIAERLGFSEEDNAEFEDLLKAAPNVNAESAKNLRNNLAQMGKTLNSPSVQEALSNAARAWIESEGGFEEFTKKHLKPEDEDSTPLFSMAFSNMDGITRNNLDSILQRLQLINDSKKRNYKPSQKHKLAGVMIAHLRALKAAAAEIQPGQVTEPTLVSVLKGIFTNSKTQREKLKGAGVDRGPSYLESLTAFEKNLASKNYRDAIKNYTDLVRFSSGLINKAEALQDALQKYEKDKAEGKNPSARQKIVYTIPARYNGPAIRYDQLEFRDSQGGAALVRQAVKQAYIAQQLIKDLANTDAVKDLANYETEDNRLYRADSSNLNFYPFKGDKITADERELLRVFGNDFKLTPETAKYLNKYGQSEPYRETTEKPNTPPPSSSEEEDTGNNDDFGDEGNDNDSSSGNDQNDDLPPWMTPPGEDDSSGDVPPWFDKAFNTGRDQNGQNKPGSSGNQGGTPGSTPGTKGTPASNTPAQNTPLNFEDLSKEYDTPEKLAEFYKKAFETDNRKDIYRATRHAFMSQIEKINQTLGKYKNFTTFLRACGANRKMVVNGLARKGHHDLARYISKLSDANYARVAEFIRHPAFSRKFYAEFAKFEHGPKDVVQHLAAENNIANSITNKPEQNAVLAAWDHKRQGFDRLVQELLCTAAYQAIINASIRQTTFDAERIRESWGVELSSYTGEQRNALIHGADISHLVNDVLHNFEKIANIKYDKNIPEKLGKGVSAGLAYNAVLAMVNAGIVTRTTINFTTDDGTPFTRDLFWFNPEQARLGEAAKKLNVAQIIPSLFTKESDLATQTTFTRDYYKGKKSAQGNQNTPSGSNGNTPPPSTPTPPAGNQNTSSTTGNNNPPSGKEKTINIWFGSQENADLSNLAYRSFLFYVPSELLGKEKGNHSPIWFRSVEDAYQSLKSGFYDESIHKQYEERYFFNRPPIKIASKISPNFTKGGVFDNFKFGRSASEPFNVNLMQELITESFIQNHDEAQKLLATGEAKFTHTQDKGFWGTKFPEILTKVRETLKANPSLLDDDLLLNKNFNHPADMAERTPIKDATALYPDGTPIPEIVSQYDNPDAKRYKTHTRQPFENTLTEVARVEAAREYKINFPTVNYFLSLVPRNNGKFARDANGRLDIGSFGEFFGIKVNPWDTEVLKESKQGKLLVYKYALNEILTNIESAINLCATEGLIDPETTVEQVVDSPELQKIISNTCVHFSGTFSNVNRLQLINGVNPLGNKLYRECLINTGMNLDLSGKTKESKTSLNYFYAAMLQGIWGEKIQDYMTLQDAADEAKEALSDEFLEKASQMLEKSKKDPSAFFNWLNKDLGIKAGDITPITVHNIQEMIRFRNAEKANQDLSNWYTDAYLDLDGQCNGSAMKYMFDTLGEFTPQWLAFVNATGITFGQMRTAAELRDLKKIKNTAGPSGKGTRKIKTNNDLYTLSNKVVMHDIIAALRENEKKLQDPETTDDEINDIALYKEVFNFIMAGNVQTNAVENVNEVLGYLIKDGTDASLDRQFAKENQHAISYNGGVNAVANQITGLFNGKMNEQHSAANKLVQAWLAKYRDVTWAPSGKKVYLYRPDYTENGKTYGWGTPKHNIGSQDLNAVALYIVNNIKEPTDKDFLKVLHTYLANPDTYNAIKGSYCEYIVRLNAFTSSAKPEEILKQLANANVIDPQTKLVKDPVKSGTSKKGKPYSIPYYLDLATFKLDQNNFNTEENFKNFIKNTFGSTVYAGFKKTFSSVTRVAETKIAISNLFTELYKAATEYTQNAQAGEPPKYGYTPAQLRDQERIAARFAPDARIGGLAVSFLKTKNVYNGNGLKVTPLIGNTGKFITLGERSVINPGVAIDPRSTLAMGDVASFANEIMRVIKYMNTRVIYDGTTGNPSQIQSISDFSNGTLNEKMLDATMSTPYWLYDAFSKAAKEIKGLGSAGVEQLFKSVSKDAGQILKLLNHKQTTFKDKDEQREYNKKLDRDIAALSERTQIFSNALKNLYQTLGLDTDQFDQFGLDVLSRILGEDFYSTKQLTNAQIRAAKSTLPLFIALHGTKYFSSNEKILGTGYTVRDLMLDPGSEHNLWNTLTEVLNDWKLDRIARTRAEKAVGVSAEHIAGAHRPMFTKGNTTYSMDTVDPKDREYKTDEQVLDELNTKFKEERAKLNSDLKSAAKIVTDNKVLVLNESSLKAFDSWFNSSRKEDQRLLGTVKYLLGKNPFNGNGKGILSGSKLEFCSSLKELKQRAVELGIPEASIDSDARGIYIESQDHILALLPGGLHKGFIDHPTRVTIAHELVHAAISKAISIARYNIAHNLPVPQHIEAGLTGLQIALTGFVNRYNQLIAKTDLPDSYKAQLNRIAPKVEYLSKLWKEHPYRAMNEFAAYALTDRDMYLVARSTSNKFIEAQFKADKNAKNILGLFKSYVKTALQKIGKILGISEARIEDLRTQLQLDPKIKSNGEYNIADLLHFSVISLSEARYNDTPSDLASAQEDVLFSKSFQDMADPMKSFMSNFNSKIAPNVDFSKATTQEMHDVAKMIDKAVLAFGIDPANSSSMTLAALTVLHGKPYTSNQFTQLARIYQNVVKNLTADMFDSAGEAKRDALLGDPADPGNLKVPAFVAIAMTSPEVQEVLKKLPKTTYEKSTGGVALDRWLMDNGNILLDKLQRSMTGTRGNNPTDELNSAMAYSVQHANTLNQAKARSTMGRTLDRINDSISNTVSAALDKISPNTAGLRRGGYGFIHQFLNSHNVPEEVRRIVEDIIASDPRKPAAEIYNSLTANKAKIDQIRFRAVSVIPRALKQLFTNKDVTKEQDIQMHKAFIASDLISVYDNYDDAAKYIKSDSARKSRIAALLKEIHAKAGAKYDKQMENLVKYLVTGEVGFNFVPNTFAMVMAEVTKQIPYNAPFDSSYWKERIELSKKMDELVSLKALDNMDLSELHKIMDTEKQGLKGVFNLMREAHSMDIDRGSVFANSNEPSFAMRMNAWKGYTPMTQTTEASLVYSKTDLSHAGFRRTKENRHIWYAPFGGNSQWNEGLVRHTRPTYQGADVTVGLSCNGFNTLLSTTEIPSLIKEGVPYRIVYSNRNRILGVEPLPSKKFVDTYIKPTFSATEQAAKYFGRILEETTSMAFSFDSIKALATNFKNAGKRLGMSPNEYVNLFELRKTNKLVDEALKMFPPMYLDYIAQQFGGKGIFMVPRNQVYEVIGIRNFSITDLFTGKTNLPESVTKPMTSLINFVLGKRGVYYLKNAEVLQQKLVHVAKNTIVVRSIVVGVGNIIANFLEGIAYGISPLEMYRSYKRVQGEVETYLKAMLDIQTYQAQQMAFEPRSKEYKDLERLIQSSQAEINSLKIKELVDWGHLGTIEDMGVTPDDLDLLTGKWGEFHEKLIGKAPEAVQTIEKYGLVTKNSALYTGLSKMMLYGDFIAKQVVKEHLEQEGKMTKEEIRNEIRDAFVDYNRLPGRGRQYLENMGLLWFWNYKLRMMRIMHKLAARNPLFFALATVLPTSIGINNLLTDNLLGNIATDKLLNSIGPGMLMQAFSLNPLVNMGSMV